MGFEPATTRLSVTCSDHCATAPHCMGIYNEQIVPWFIMLPSVLGDTWTGTSLNIPGWGDVWVDSFNSVTCIRQSSIITLTNAQQIFNLTRALLRRERTMNLTQGRGWRGREGGREGGGGGGGRERERWREGEGGMNVIHIIIGTVEGSFHVKSSDFWPFFHGPPPILLKFGTLVELV